MTGSPRRAPEKASVVDLATAILIARRGCTPDEASLLLSDAAQGYRINISDLAECLVADQELRQRPRTSPG